MPPNPLLTAQDAPLRVSPQSLPSSDYISTSLPLGVSESLPL